jgi:PadR family transcriptional regulator PadR
LDFGLIEYSGSTREGQPSGLNDYPDSGRVGHLVLSSWILLLVSDQPSHGYQLVHALVELGVYGGNSGYVYRALRTMEASGVLVSEWQQSDCGRLNRVYELTTSGYDALDRCAARVTDLAGQLHLYLDRYRRGRTIRSVRIRPTASAQGPPLGGGAAAAAREAPKRRFPSRARGTGELAHPDREVEGQWKVIPDNGPLLETMYCDFGDD